MDVVYTDFAKAFDKVSHRKLLHKLRFFGLGQRIVEYIRSFLTGKSQRVVLGDASSSWVGVESGVKRVLKMFKFINFFCKLLLCFDLKKKIRFFINIIIFFNIINSKREKYVKINA